MRYAERAEVLVYKGQTKATRTLGWSCSACDEAIFTGQPLVARERAFQELEAEVDGVLDPASVTRAREARAGTPRR